jgi:uncharacterized protein (DUF2384 family)
MEKNQFEEPLVPYGISDNEILTFLNTKDINWQYVNAIKRLTAFTDETISDWLNISVKTFRSYKLPENKFKANLKEHIVLLLSVINHGIKVFGTAENFDQWLSTENFYFDKKSPVDYLNTITGIRFIDDRLTGMEYGDNA